MFIIFLSISYGYYITIPKIYKAKYFFKNPYFAIKNNYFTKVTKIIQKQGFYPGFDKVFKD